MKWFLPERKGGELKLSDYANIWTKFCFLDESGTLDNPTVPFFTIGYIKCSEPYYLASKIGYERNKKNFHDELKFNKLSANNIAFAKFAVDALFDTKSVHFHSYTVDKEGEYFKSHYPSDPWTAYEDVSVQVLAPSISDNEILMVIADHVTTPKHVRYEVDLKRRINALKQRLAVAGVCRFNSKSNDLLQLTDLLIGCINYDLKKSVALTATGDRYKTELANYFKEKLSIDTFLHGHRAKTFNIFVDKDILLRKAQLGK